MIRRRVLCLISILWQKIVEHVKSTLTKGYFFIAPNSKYCIQANGNSFAEVCVNSYVNWFYQLKQISTPEHLNWAGKLIWFLFRYYSPKVQKVTESTIRWQHPHTVNKRILLIHELIGQWSQIALGILKKEACHSFLQCNTVFLPD